MATILIEPITAETRGGFRAHIVVLDPTNGDCIIGDVRPHGVPQTGVRWNLDGTARNQPSECNLDMSDDDLSELARLARQLGAE